MGSRLRSIAWTARLLNCCDSETMTIAEQSHRVQEGPVSFSLVAAPVFNYGRFISIALGTANPVEARRLVRRPVENWMTCLYFCH